MAASKAQRAATAQRRNRAIALRLAGADYESIAAQLGYASRGAAYTDITRALESALVEQRQDREVFRDLERLRLDRLQAAVWAQAMAGDVKSAEAVLRIIDRRIRLLGLDAPQRVEVLTLDAIEAEIQALSAQLGAAGEGVPTEHAHTEPAGRAETGGTS